MKWFYFELKNSLLFFQTLWPLQLCWCCLTNSKCRVASRRENWVMPWRSSNWSIVSRYSWNSKKILQGFGAPQWFSGESTWQWGHQICEVGWRGSAAIHSDQDKHWTMAESLWIFCHLWQLSGSCWRKCIKSNWATDSNLLGFRHRPFSRLGACVWLLRGRFQPPAAETKEGKINLKFWTCR